jgi:hypothetical protein
MTVSAKVRLIWQESAACFLWQRTRNAWPQSSAAALTRFVRTWFAGWAERFRSVLTAGFSLLRNVWQSSVAATAIPSATHEKKEAARKPVWRRSLLVARPRGRRKRLT